MLWTSKLICVFFVVSKGMSDLRSRPSQTSKYSVSGSRIRFKKKKKDYQKYLRNRIVCPDPSSRTGECSGSQEEVCIVPIRVRCHLHLVHSVFFLPRKLQFLLLNSHNEHFAMYSTAYNIRIVTTRARRLISVVLVQKSTYLPLDNYSHA